MAAERTQVHFLKFPVSDVASLGQIEKLVVTVSCSWISALKNVPELYNIEMGYKMPTENVLEARPRLGGAAVALSRWSGVIGIRVPSDSDAKSCFAVTVTAEGRSGVARKWKGQQLGLPRDA
jgi:hypothetical protein